MYLTSLIPEDDIDAQYWTLPAMKVAIQISGNVRLELKSGT